MWRRRGNGRRFRPPAIEHGWPHVGALDDGKQRRVRIRIRILPRRHRFGEFCRRRSRYLLELRSPRHRLHCTALLLPIYTYICPRACVFTFEIILNCGRWELGIGILCRKAKTRKGLAFVYDCWIFGNWKIGEFVRLIGSWKGKIFFFSLIFWPFVIV